MSFLSLKELPRKAVYEIGQTRQLTREFVVVRTDNAIDSPVSESAVLVATGLDLGQEHPTYTGQKYKLSKLTYSEAHEGSPYHGKIVADYRVVLDSELLSPTARTYEWTFSSAPGEVPALFYYSGAGNGTKLPLTNSAYDYFPGLVTQESVITILITANWASLPTSWIAAQNFVNDGTFLGCPAGSVRVEKVTVEPDREDVSGVVTAFWRATAELRYRQSGHSYQLPDIGFNFIDSGQKRRCMVFDFQNSEWIPSPNPVGLNGSGAQTGGAPTILTRRVNPETNFTTLFGAPPTTPTT
jgi:hypothetical protein